MLIREVLAGVLADGRQLLLSGPAQIPAAVDIGAFRSCLDTAEARAGDVVLTFVAASSAPTDYWPTPLSDGVHAVAVVVGGMTSAPLGAVVREATRRGLQIVDAISVTDLANSVAMVGLSTRRPMPPRNWLSDGAEAQGAEAKIMAALSTHVLDRSVGAFRADLERHDRATLERERARSLENLARLEAELATHSSRQLVSQEQGFDIGHEHRFLARRVEAIYRSRTWRVGRLFWAIVHPVKTAEAVRYRRAGQLKERPQF